MKGLRARLSKAGIKPKFLNEVILPDWWEDSIASSEAGFREAVGYIGSHLGLSLRSLLDEDALPTFAKSSKVLYKKAKGITNNEVNLATQYALGVARSVAGSFTEKAPSHEVPDPKRWREELLQVSDRPWVCLRHILAASWNLGIPVVQLRNFPAGAKKPDALATIVNDRPVIVILNQRTSPSWIAFIVAHELGHIHHKHLKAGQTLVDQKVSGDAVENEEKEANDFAVRLLTGHSDLGLNTTQRMFAQQLASACRSFGEKNRIAPGVAALNYGFTTQNWALANGALSILEEKDDASEEMKSCLLAMLDSEDLSEEAWGLISRSTGIDG